MKEEPWRPFFLLPFQAGWWRWLTALVKKLGRETFLVHEYVKEPDAAETKRFLAKSL